jgi:hypothetical protein
MPAEDGATEAPEQKCERCGAATTLATISPALANARLSHFRVRRLQRPDMDCRENQRVIHSSVARAPHRARQVREGRKHSPVRQQV